MAHFPAYIPVEQRLASLRGLLTQARTQAVGLSLDEDGAPAFSLADAGAAIQEALTCLDDAETARCEIAIDQAAGHYDLGGAWHGPEEEAA